MPSIEPRETRFVRLVSLDCGSLIREIVSRTLEADGKEATDESRPPWSSWLRVSVIFKIRCRSTVHIGAGELAGRRTGKQGGSVLNFLPKRGRQTFLV